jgi:hypothetical protein
MIQYSLTTSLKNFVLLFSFLLFFLKKLLAKRQKGQTRMKGALAALLVATTAICAAGDVSVSMASATLGPTGARGRDAAVPAPEEKVPISLRPQYILSILNRLPWRSYE